MAAEVPAEADLYEGKREVLPAEVVDVGVGTGWQILDYKELGGNTSFLKI